MAEGNATPARPVNFRLTGALLLPLLGAVAFALLHLAYSDFYSKFGLVPEDVGLDSSRLLTTSLTAILAAFAIWAVVWLFVAGPFLLVLFWTEVQRIYGGSRMVVFGFVFLLAVSAAWLLTTERSTPGLLKVFAWLVVVASGAFFLRDRVGQKQWDEMTRERLGLAVVAVFVSLALGATVTISGFRGLGARYGERAFEGLSFRSVKIDLPRGFPSWRALDIRADLVHVDWLQGRPSSVGSHDCLLYLGSSGGSSVLFDVHTPKQLLRVPTSAVILAAANAPFHCNKSGNYPESHPNWD